MSEIIIDRSQALFAAGCFWGVELTFSDICGVLATEVGYSGGFAKDPTYQQVCSGRTGHAECVRLEYNPDLVSYAELLDVFWNCHDPSSLNAQGPDMGSQYRSAIFWHTEEQKLIAEHSKLHLNEKYRKEGKTVKTEIHKAGPFYRAEDYHQKYLHKKNKSHNPTKK